MRLDQNRPHRTLVRLLPLLALGALAACGDSETAQGAVAEPQPVVLGAADVATARLASLQTGPTLTGSLQPADVVELKAQIAGTISDLRVDRGSSVREGQVLARIEAAGIRSQAAGARAAVAAAQANLAVARQQLEAARTLQAAGAMSEIDLRSAEAGYEAAEAQLAAARAQAASAGEAAGHATVRSPITGVVSARDIEEGESVSPGTELLTVVNSSRLELAGQVPVQQAAQVRVGQPVRFTLDAYPGRDFRGTVARMDPTADPSTRQVGIYVQMPNPGREIIGGQFARGRVLGDTRETVVVPESAVRQEGQERYVFVIENGRIARRTVVVVGRDDATGEVGITSGVQAGEQVVSAAGATIAPGTAVTVAADAAPSAPADAGAAGAAGEGR